MLRSGMLPSLRCVVIIRYETFPWFEWFDRSREEVIRYDFERESVELILEVVERVAPEILKSQVICECADPWNKPLLRIVTK